MAYIAPSTQATGAIISAGTWNQDVVANMKANPAELASAAGDTFYGAAANTLAKLPIGAVGQVLRVNGAGNAPEWGEPSPSALLYADATARSMVGNSSWVDIPGYAANLTLTSTGKVFAMAEVYAVPNGGCSDAGQARLMIGANVVHTLPAGMYGYLATLFGYAAATASGAQTVKLQHYGANSSHSASFRQLNLMAFG
jgi:hypothetical protein